MTRWACTGNQFYRYQFGKKRVKPGYPKTLGSSVELTVDAALHYNGVKYFFSGTGYQIFDDDNLGVSFTFYNNICVDSPVIAMCFSYISYISYIK